MDIASTIHVGVVVGIVVDDHVSPAGDGGVGQIVAARRSAVVAGWPDDYPVGKINVGVSRVVELDGVGLSYPPLSGAIRSPR